MNPRTQHPILNRSLALLAVTLLLGAGSAVQAANGTWTNLAAGSWTHAANWLNGVIPNGVGDSATINANLTAGRAITLDTNVTVGALSVGDPAASFFNYTLSAGTPTTNQLIFDQPGTADATLTYPVTTSGAGVNPISAGITLNDHLVIYALTPFLSAHTISGSITDGTNSCSLTLDPTSTGIVAFSASNSYHGGTFVKSGRFQITRGDALGYGPVLIRTNAQVYNVNATSITNDFSLVGVGWVAAANQMGALRLDSGRLSGALTLTGNARIGVFQGANGQITNNTISGHYELELANGNTATSPSTINLAPVANTTAATRITALGTQPINVVVWTNTALSSGPLTMSGGILKLNGIDLSFSNLTSTASGGQIQVGTALPATLTVGTDGSSTSYGGTLADGGGTLALTKVGAGTLTLTGDNNYTGNTTVSNGTLKLVRTAGGLSGASAVTVKSGATFGGSGGVAGPVTLEQGGVFLVEGTIGAPLTSAALTLGATVGDATTTLINVAQGNFCSGGTVSVSGTNTIQIIGAAPNIGVYDLITYTGSTPFAGFKLGSLPFGVVATLQDSGTAIRLNVTSTLVESKLWRGNLASVWSPSAGNEWLGTVSGSARPYVDGDNVIFNDTATNFAVNLTASVVPSGVLVSNQTQAYTISGPGGIGGFGNLVKGGAAVLTLSTTNSYAGDTVVNTGTLIQAAPNTGIGNTLINPGATLQLGEGGTAGNLAGGGITNHGVLACNRSDSLTIPVAIEGAGSLVKQGAGTLVLTAANSYSGGTLVSGGTLQVGANSGTGSIEGDLTNNATVMFFRADGSADVQLFNNISGTGLLHFRGNTQGNQGRYALWGDNSRFTGPLLANLARVAVSSQANLGAAPIVTSTNASQIFLNAYDTFTNQFAIAGNGWPESAGTLGTLHFGGDAVLSGPVVLVGPARLVANAGVGATLGGALSGSAALEIGGAGTAYYGAITNAGNGSGFTGPVTISRGSFVVNGPLGASGVTVAAPGVLGGNGVLSGTVLNHGTLAPGAGVGTLATGSEVWNGGSINAVEITNAVTAGGWDRLSIAGTLDLQAVATNPVTLRLTTLAADGAPGPMEGFTNTATYIWPIATASGGILNFAGNKFVVDPSGVLNDTTTGTSNVFTVGASGNALVLKFGPPGPDTNPTNLAAVVNGANLDLSWPADHTGWRLETQTNALSVGLGNHWVTWPGSDTTNAVSVPLGPANPAVFFRLVYP
jgi:autotransporter-associated beta strand protein